MEVQNPYPEISKNKDVVDYVLGGQRLPKPESCPQELYSLMLKTWEANPADRPDFETLIRALEKIPSIPVAPVVITPVLFSDPEAYTTL